jgi:hypothetical protein
MTMNPWVVRRHHVGSDLVAQITKI